MAVCCLCVYVSGVPAYVMSGRELFPIACVVELLNVKLVVHIVASRI
jgi:hypothetical protein